MKMLEAMVMKTILSSVFSLIHHCSIAAAEPGPGSRRQRGPGVWDGGPMAWHWMLAIGWMDSFGPNLAPC